MGLNVVVSCVGLVPLTALAICGLVIIAAAVVEMGDPDGEGPWFVLVVGVVCGWVGAVVGALFVAVAAADVTVAVAVCTTPEAAL